MAPPICPGCGTELTELESPALRRTWKKDEGFKWSWHSPVQAYWHLRQDCHQAAWPVDKRVSNRWSRPGDAWWPSLASSRRCRLVVGDFYLTESPPELLRPKPGLPGASSTQRREAPRLPGQGLPATRPRSRSPPPRRSCLTSPAAGVQRTTPRAKGKVCFASPAQRFFVPRKEKSDLDFGAASCDACGKAFEERLTTGFAVKLAETTETENQRHKALLCSSCRQHLLKGGRLLLTSLEAEAEAAWATTRLTCRQRLEKHGAPYTPKPKR